MKVYVILGTRACSDIKNIVKVYSTKEAAEKHVRQLEADPDNTKWMKGLFEIVEHEVVEKEGD